MAAQSISPPAGADATGAEAPTVLAPPSAPPMPATTRPATMSVGFLRMGLPPRLARGPRATSNGARLRRWSVTCREPASTMLRAGSGGRSDRMGQADDHFDLRQF